MSEPICQTVFLYGFCDIFGVWVENFRMFSHCDCMVRIHEHRQIIAAVTEDIGSFFRNAELFHDKITGRSLGIPLLYHFVCILPAVYGLHILLDELKKSTIGTENLKTFEDNIELTNDGGKIKFSAKGSSSEEIARFSVSGLSNIYYVNGSEGSYVTTMHRTWTFTLAEVEGPSDELDFSKYVVVDASYEQLPEGQEFFTSFQNSEGETCYYVGNNEPDYKYAYFGSSDKTGAFTKDDDGKVKFGHFAVSAYDAAGNLIGYKSIANN